MSEDKRHTSAARPAVQVSVLRKIRIFCAEQNLLLRDGIARAVNGQPNLDVVGEATSAEKAIARYSAELYSSKYTLRTHLLSTIRSIFEGSRVAPFEIAARLASLMGINMLRDRELEILRLIDQEKSPASTAKAFGISEQLVADHTGNILRRLHAHDLRQALTIARNRGHLEPQRV